jgi:hypothetical protein
MPVLWKSEYMTAEHRVASRIVCFVRSAQPFPSPETVQQEVTEWQRSLGELPLSELGVLLDWRLVPLETNPDILRELVLRTDALARQFARQALLMESSLGVLQANRLSRAHETTPVVFTNEAEAHEYVTSR